MKIATLEGQIDQSPADYRKRFNLGYLHAKLGNGDVSLRHYLQIPWEERQAMDWNNIGAAYADARVDGRAAQAFRKSEAMGGTLAMANLGFSMLHTGFVDEAKALCTKALAIEGFHKNVGKLATAIREIDENETKTVNSILEQSKSRAAFYRQFGISFGLPELKFLPSTWEGPDCHMMLIREADEIQLFGSFERPSNSLASLLATSFSSKNLVRHDLKYVGILWGRTVIGTVKRKSSETPSSLASGESDERFLMILSETEIQTLELSGKAEPAKFKIHSPSHQLPSN